MEAIIMAAGTGKRIRALTGGNPKSYLEIQGERLLGRQLRLLNQTGVTKTIVVTGYKTEVIRDDFADTNVVFAFNPFFETTNVLVSFWCAQHLLSEDFVYLHADTVFHEDILKKLLDHSGDIVLPVDFKHCGMEEMKVRVDGDRVMEISKQIPPAAAQGEFIGIAKLSKNVLWEIKASVERLLIAKKFDEYFEASLQDLIDRRISDIRCFPTNGLPWNEIDSSEDYLHAKQLFEASQDR